MSEKQKPNELPPLSLQEALHIIILTNQIARGNNEINPEIYSLIHLTHRKLKLNQSDVTQLAYTIRDTLDRKISNQTHPQVSQLEYHTFPEEDAQSLYAALSGEENSGSKNLLIQDVLTKIAQQDIYWQQGTSVGGAKSHTNTSVLCEYILGVGNPPQRKHVSEPVDTVLQHMQDYLKNTSLHLWIQRVIRLGSADLRPQEIDFIRDIKQAIDLYNANPDHLEKAPYPPIIQELIAQGY